MFYKGKITECSAEAVEHNEKEVVPRLAEYVRHSHGDRLGITTETTEEELNELVTAAAKTYPIVVIKPQLRVKAR